ncbi:mitochondrial tRNA methylthiotransferase CDK5RAP1-like [Babylonia areolata]|uniref:mitochondrial tRNA methylthiotransferase CDK5RAP1-like n=1 Tax=Babylonia areolata TaxID=304850 RepID=UPI003FD56E58
MCQKIVDTFQLIKSHPCSTSSSDPQANGISSRRSQDEDCGQRNRTARKLPQSGPELSDFILKSMSRGNEADSGNMKQKSTDTTSAGSVPYIHPEMLHGNQRKVYFQTYGCQMNVSDTEIAWSILEKSGYTRTDIITEADVILLMTCAIREGAEDKVWSRLEYFKSLKRKQRGQRAAPVTIGILGCMAERLKQKIVEREKMVDVVCGPDAYRDLPHLLASSFVSGQAAVNVQLSLEETYADIIPVRPNPDNHSAFVSIMRGCDNMCTYCIVPFTRGRERSRPLTSIVEEVKQLSDQGIKEVTLLGQNVNSYRDLSETSSRGGVDIPSLTEMSRGFRTVYKPRSGGHRFADLLEKVSEVDPEMRIRFTSPHPKDFPDEVLNLIQERPNICRQIHLPAQSGSDAMLEAMGRGYTRAAYLELVNHIRSIIPDVALSSDFIAGFCGETEANHQETLTLIRSVQYNFAFCFPYSMRQKTRAFHRLKDDVPADVKQRRHTELVAAFRAEAEKIHASQIGSKQLVLVEGTSKRSSKDWVGRNEANTRVIFPKAELPSHRHTLELSSVGRGDYVAVQIISGTSQILRAVPLYHTTLQDFWKHKVSSSRNGQTAESFKVQL